MIEPKYLSALREIYARLKDCRAIWVVTGSFGMALQGMDIKAHDIDIQTDQQGAYEIESKLSEYVVVPVRFSESEKIRSHFGKLEIDGVKVEIMGDIQKRVDGRTWEAPVNVEHNRQWVEIVEMQIPVSSLEKGLRWREIEKHLQGVETILDVGGATGAFSIPLARRGFLVTHLDFSPAMLEVAAQKAQGVNGIQDPHSLPSCADGGRMDSFEPASRRAIIAGG